MSSRGPRYSEEEARAAIGQSFSWSEALRRLGMCRTGGGAEVLKKWAARWEISTEHFDQYRNIYRGTERRPLDEILVENSTYARNHLKQRLYDEGLKTPVCELCGQGEVWRGKRMGLILDHTNGVADDNRLENLRIVCPNCAATLDTHCGRKVRIERPRRSCLRCGEDFRPRYRNHRYCSRACGSRWDRSDVKRRSRPETRKVERPPRERLLREVDELGYRATGRKYGVSDNAVRKWLRAYEQERLAAEGRDPAEAEIPVRTWPNRRRDDEPLAA